MHENDSTRLKTLQHEKSEHKSEHTTQMQELDSMKRSDQFAPCEYCNQYVLPQNRVRHIAFKCKKVPADVRAKVQAPFLAEEARIKAVREERARCREANRQRWIETYRRNREYKQTQQMNEHDARRRSGIGHEDQFHTLENYEGIRRCRFCGNPAMGGSDLCYSCESH